MTGRLAGKTALVTAAGQGMGRAGALAFAREGAGVIATDLKPELLASMRDTPGITTRSLNVLDAAAVAAAVQDIGDANILFNCAGWVHQGSLPDCTIGDWDRGFDLNVRSIFVVVKALSTSSATSHRS
jgi:2-keto-3-deoxy-L-fuconate dehydrogenase